MSAASEDSRQRLGFHLEMQEGFWLALVVGEDEEAMAELRDDAGLAGAVRDVEASEGREVSLALELTGQRAALTWIALRDKEVARVLLSAMNERREAYRRSGGPGIILEGPTWLKVELRDAAPDLFSIRACILEPVPATEGLLDPEADERVRAALRPAAAPHVAIPPASIRERVRAELVRARDLAGREGESALRARIASLRRAASDLLAQGWFGEAEPIVTELLGLLEHEAPDALWTLPEAVTAWEMRGMTARQLGHLGESREALGHALDALAVLRSGRPLDGSTAALHEDEARLSWLLGEVAWASGELAQAQQHLAQALGLRESLLAFRSASNQELSAIREGLARTWSLLADVAEASGRLEDAADAWVSALAIRADLVELRPQDPATQRAFSIALGRVARVAEAEGDLTGALELRRRAWQVAVDLQRDHPESAENCLDETTARTHLARTLLAQGRSRSARFHLEAVRDVRVLLLRQDPTNVEWCYRLAASMQELAEVALAEGDGGAAASWAHRSLRRLEELDGGRVQVRLARERGLRLRAEAYLRLGRYRSAGQDFEAASRTLEALIEEDPRSRWSQRHARVATRAGDAWMAGGEEARAVVCWRAALGDLQLTQDALVHRARAGRAAVLGPLVGLAQVGEVPNSLARAVVDALETAGELGPGEAAAWKAALAVAESSQSATPDS